MEAATDPRTVADALWSRNTTVRTRVHPQLKQTLGRMAPGHERCMYCGDNQGCAIDHFEPLAVNPLRAFDWANHLLACTICNSHFKRGEFPRDEHDGSPLLLDPTGDEPLHHLHLNLAAGSYSELSARGAASIEVLGLNRPLLVKGRRDAYTRAVLFLGQWHRAWRSRDGRRAEEIVRLAWNQPLADVLASMFHQAAHPAAAALFVGEEELLTFLTDPEVRAGFGSVPPADAEADGAMP
ncbi:HNH endonuclease [Streptomyces sp. NPDC006332]|uniref:HNH endonuclease n=1 Tax=Streptomyces sp. NPDC006332 TaxID=3155456 RepID=UPI00339E18A6